MTSNQRVVGGFLGKLAQGGQAFTERLKRSAAGKGILPVAVLLRSVGGET
jgi:hypothetical protein